MQFIKFHGFGNDYLVFEAAQLKSVNSLNDFARRISDRHYGAGADGITMVSPNCIIFVDDFDELDWRRIGRLIENHEQFPERTNVVFVRVRDRSNIEIRLWERGVGETFSSGTCSCAAAVASCINEKTDRHVNVHTQGGLIEVTWREDGEVLMTGRADIVYRGEWLRRDEG